MRQALPATLDEARRSFWLLPAIGLMLGVGLGLGLPAIDISLHVDAPVLRFEHFAAARTLLQTIATASISVAGVAFSVTVVAFQLASQQLSPRVLRTFQANRLSQGLLAILLGLFVYCLLVLAQLPRHPPAPQLSITMAIALAILAFALFAAFLHDVVVSLQASTLIRRIAADGHRALRNAYPSSLGRSPADVAAAEEHVRQVMARERGVVVTAPRAGFLVMVRPKQLLEVTQRHDALVAQRLPLGDFAVTGAVLAEVWARGEAAEIESEVAAAFALGDERTVVQDVAFPVRQLADIALRAVSPALNDPTTAENAMDSLADTLVVFARCDRPPALRCDEDGTPRFMAQTVTLDDLVRLGFAQVGRAGATYPVFAKRLLTLLAHIRATADDIGIRCDEARLQADAISRRLSEPL